MKGASSESKEKEVQCDKFSDNMLQGDSNLDEGLRLFKRKLEKFVVHEFRTGEINQHLAVFINHEHEENERMGSLASSEEGFSKTLKSCSQEKTHVYKCTQYEKEKEKGGCHIRC
uniref:Uncharacterized protein n=1 Tax=Magallana gigas TaxID=29159 RepID=A0A8W8HR19_MAGGI